MVFCIGAYQQWFESEENKIWVKNHNTAHPATFQKTDPNRPRFNLMDEGSVRCHWSMVNFLHEEMKILNEHPLNELKNSKYFLEPCKKFKVKRDEEDMTMSAMTVGANGSNEQKCKYFEHSDNSPMWQNYNHQFYRIANGKKSLTEKSWYHPANFGHIHTSNWNGRITLWDDTFVILFNQQYKENARRVAKVVASMLDPSNTGSIDNPELQKKLFNAQAHILMGCKYQCNQISDAENYKKILKKLKKCETDDECKKWDSLYHMKVYENYEDLNELERFVRSAINGFVKSADAYAETTTPSFFNHMALTSMTVDDNCGDVYCQQTNLIGLTQMVIDGRFNNDADCEKAMVQFGWGDSDNLACTENDLITLGHENLVQAAKKGFHLGKPNEKYCKEPIYTADPWPGIECFQDQPGRTRIFNLQKSDPNAPDPANHCCGGPGNDQGHNEYDVASCGCDPEDLAITKFKKTDDNKPGFYKYMRPVDAMYIAADENIPNEKLSKLASLVAQFFDSLHDQYDDLKHKGWQTKGWFYSLETDPSHPDKGNQQPHTMAVRSMVSHYAYIPVCKDGENGEADCPIKFLHSQFHPVPIKLSMFDPDNFDDLSKDHSLRALIFNFLGFVGMRNAGVSQNAIWDTVCYFSSNDCSKASSCQEYTIQYSPYCTVYTLKRTSFLEHD